MEDAGQKLKRVRERLRLKYRDVEEASVRIGAARGNDEYVVSLSRLSDIENKPTLPSLYKLYSLCVIYRLDLSEVLAWYGISSATMPADAAAIDLPRTHTIGFQVDEGEVQVPIALDPGIDISKTVFLSRFIQRWGSLPLMLLGNRDLRSYRYGYIGSEDWSMSPLIPPGSLVVIDESRRRIASSGWTGEFDRPIYFFELRDGNLCGWASFDRQEVTVQFHPASSYAPQTFDYPGEIEILGQVTEVAMTLDPARRRRRS